MIRQSNLSSLSYDDVLLVPRYSTVDSRDDVNLFYNGEDHYPIFSAPMSNVSNADFIITLDKLGGIGILHRFFKDEKERYESVEKLNDSYATYGVAIGVNNFEKELEFMQFALDNNCKYICIDVAYGSLEKVLDFVKRVNTYKINLNKDFEIIAGNVATLDGVRRLNENGSDFARVGIGNGSLCSSRNKTGCAVPDLTAIKDCSKLNKVKRNIKLIADGGIKSSGEAVKALAFGADYVMLGGLFGRSFEANNGGLLYGMSSKYNQLEMNKKVKSDEGLVKKISENDLQPLADIFNDFVYGIKSGFSYLGCNDINELHNLDMEYIKVSRNAIKQLDN